MGPALRGMGTLIPLSPALAGLTDGDAATLSENRRVAFSVTVTGLLIGADFPRPHRLYAQDYSDVEYIAAASPHHPPMSTPSPTAHWAVAPWRSRPGPAAATTAPAIRSTA